MNGRHHLTLSLLSLFLLLYPWFSSLSTMVLALAVIGTVAGSLAPDVDAQDTKLFHMKGLPAIARMFFAGLGYLLRYLIYLPLSLLFWIALGQNYRHEHRGMLHTPLGSLLMSLLLFTYTAVALLLLGRSMSVDLLVFFAAFAGGCLLHLLQDSCTPAGIAWGFPRSNRRLRGGIRTGSRRDPRPFLFGAILAGSLALLVVLGERFPMVSRYGLSIALLAGSWVFFLLLARSGVPSSS